MRNVTLVAAASGTALSAVTKRLNDRSGISAVDLETVMLREVIDWAAFGNPASEMRNMGTVCSQATRAEVIEYWDRAFARSVDQLLGKPEDEALVLSTHVNLFSGSRLEFYGTPLARRIEEYSDVGVAQVIVLIDDIYDMYRRLSGSAEIYGDDVLALREHEAHSSRLTDYVFGDDQARSEHGETVEGFDDSARASLHIELTAKNLMRLLHWRRSEMLSGEELARNFDCRYTAFGVKHEFESLVELVGSPQARTVYVSHKITEPRVENVRAELRGTTDYWPELVSDVNALAAELRSRSLIAIQPTAIDELRFMKNVDRSKRLLRYSGRLAARWPVHQEAASRVNDADAPRYQHLLDHSRTDHDSYRHGVFGLFQHVIYDEIAFRDHQLVSSNEALLVYRPTAMGAYVSGGVEKEIGHWARSLQYAQMRPAVFLHVRDELIDGLRAASEGNRQGQTRWGARSALIKNLSSFLGEAQAGELWRRCVEEEEAIAQFLPALSMHLGRVDAQSARRIAVALEQTATAIVSALCTVPASALSKAAHFTYTSPTQGVPGATIRDIADLIHDPNADAFEAQNKRLLEDLLGHLRLADSLEFIRFACGYPLVSP